MASESRSAYLRSDNSHRFTSQRPFSRRLPMRDYVTGMTDRLSSVADKLTGIRPLVEWLDELRNGVELLTRVGPNDT